MSLKAFKKKGRFYKGNIHTHSNLSDGRLLPDDVCEAYIKRGYDFISITDHFLGMFKYPLTRIKSNFKNFCTILGAELHTSKMKNGELWHILALGLTENFIPPEQPSFLIENNSESAQKLVSRCLDAGAFVSLTHPEWNGLTLEDTNEIKNAHAIEIYNHSSSIECDRGYGLSIFEQMLNEGKRINIIATDDAHFQTKDAFGGWIMVKAENNNSIDLLDALKKGYYYSSQGPEIFDISINNKELSVSCSPVSYVIVSGYGSSSLFKNKPDICETVFQIGSLPKNKWIRVTIVDKNGKKAWSNPIFDY